MFCKEFPRNKLLLILTLLILVLGLGCAGNPAALPDRAAPHANPEPTPPPEPPPPPPPAPVVPPSIKYIALVVLQNKSYSEIIDNPDMPWLNSLARQYAIAANYFANGHEGIPDSFMLTTGDTITTDAGYSEVVTLDNVVRQLVAGNKTWKVYAEALPSVGYLGNDQYPYIKVHNPFVYLSDVVNNPAQAANVVPFTQLAADLTAGTLPNYLYIVPDNYNNGHDCPQGTPNCTLDDVLQNTDNWLKTNIAPLLANQDFKDRGILIVTFDESRADDTANGGGHVLTVVAGAKVKLAYKSDVLYQHQSTLRLMIKALGLTSYPGAAATAPDMDEFFTGPLP